MYTVESKVNRPPLGEGQAGIEFRCLNFRTLNHQVNQISFLLFFSCLCSNIIEGCVSKSFLL